MKKIILPLVFISIVSFGFSQEATKELSENEKDELRAKHQSGLSFEKRESSSSKQLTTTNSTEEDKEEKQTTIVNYYYGTSDTAFKVYKYKKP